MASLSEPGRSYVVGFVVVAVLLGVGVLIMDKQNQAFKEDCADHLNKPVEYVDESDASACRKYWRRNPEPTDGDLGNVVGRFLGLLGIIGVASVSAVLVIGYKRGGLE